MKNSFFGITVRNSQEFTMLVICTLQTFFTGAFISLFLIGSHVLFLQSWEPEKLTQAFILSGIFGILLFSVYSYFASRTNVRKMTFWALFALLIGNILISLNYDNIATYRLLGIPLMLPFTLCFPVVFFIFVLLRNSFANIFKPEQHRRFFPAIRASLIAGIVIASYALVGALYINWDILLIIKGSTIFIGLATLAQLIGNRVHSQSPVFPQPVKHTAQLRSRFYELFYTRYTFLLLAFVVLSAVVGFTIQYLFISETRFNYPHTIGLAKFFGFFMGTMFIFIYVVERFLIRKILYTYDSPYSLSLVPVLMAVAAGASLLVNLLVGQSNAISRFSFYFLMVAMIKIGFETTYETIELPTLRVLFRTLDLRFQSSVRPRFEGSIRMSGLIISGLFIMTLLSIHFKNKSLLINIAILLFTLAWIYIGIKLVKSYQSALREFIRRLKTSKKAVGQSTTDIHARLQSLIYNSNPVKSINALAIVERLEPLVHEKQMVLLLDHDSAELRNYLLNRISENALLSSLPKLKELQQTNHLKNHGGQLSKLISKFEIKLNTGTSNESILNIVGSNILTDRILAAEIIGSSGNQCWSDHLLHLSRDFEPEVKLASAKAMARLGNPNHSYVLIGYLTTPGFYAYAFEALIKIGDPAFPYMEQMFLLPEADNILLSRIVRIYGKIGSPAAIDLLLAKIENQNRTIMHQALLALHEAKFQSTAANLNRILNCMVRLISTMSWNFAAYSSFRGSRFDLLKNAMESEINSNYNTLYNLLALAYNSTSIGNIKTMLMEGTDTDISFAIELLDQIVNEEIKQVFFPVVENVSVRERYRQLQYFFHATRETPEDLIQEIIIRDFNQISLYAKACAIISTLNTGHKEAGQEIIASIFHPNQVIRETAAYVLSRLEPEMLESVYTRLEQGHVNELRSVISKAESHIPCLLLDKISFIKKCNAMKNLSEDILLEIATALDIHQMPAREEFLIKHEDVHFAFIIVVEGSAQINISSGKVFTFEKNDIIYSDLFVEDSTYSLRASTDLTFYSLDQEVLNTLMFDFIDFREAVFGIIEEA
jgi:ATP:ADP antiporter, AAA family